MLQSQESARPPRASTPERWQHAADRAFTEGIEVRHVADSGAWVATSGRDSATAYTVDVTGAIAHGCGCLAGLNDDPVCKHRAAFYLLIGALAPTPATRQCPECCGGGVVYIPDCERAGWPHPACPACQGSGELPASIIETHIGRPPFGLLASAAKTSAAVAA
jgi:hypothetical protein